MAEPLIQIKAQLPPVQAGDQKRVFQNMAGGRLRRRFNRSRQNIQAGTKHKRLYSGLRLQQHFTGDALSVTLLAEPYWIFADYDTPGIGEPTATGGVRTKGVPWGEGTLFHEWASRVTPFPGTSADQMEFLLARQVSREGTEGEYVVAEELQELIPDLERIAAQVSVDFTNRMLGAQVAERGE